MRKLVVFLIVIGILLVVVDRVAVVGVQREIAKQVEAQYDLTDPPSVQIKGVPFLTQAISGRYDEIAVAIGPLTRQGVQLSSIDATLYGVTAPLSQLIQNPSGADIRAERITGTVVISHKTLSAQAPRGIKIEGGGGGGTLRVSGELTFLGRQVPVTADMRLDVVQGGVKLTPVNVKLAGAIPVPNPERYITYTVPVKDLPLNLRITGVKTTPQGLAIEGTATDVPLR
ncbi:DUF2993 domain-containing protein [Microbispora sp. NPDC049125]|uniref:LmeA family phospholipid-binding protein n=1 Tax=Microbispora sp. NPDC049125 TaxID=3154929 RepID=UPI003465A658